MNGKKKVIQWMTQQTDRNKVIQLSGYSHCLISFLSATGYQNLCGDVFTFHTIIF
jgi:hypothetical protein